jgi:membrane protease YdiL (CAAX protease family)
MPQIDPWVVAALLPAAGVAWWVHADAVSAGLSPGRTWVWTLLSALIVFLPAYLLFGRPPQATGRWGLGEVVGGIGAVVILILVLAPVFGLRGTDTLPEVTAGVLLQQAVTVLVVGYVVAVRYRLPLSAVGFRGRGVMRLLGVGLGLGIFSILASTLAEQVAMEIAASVVGPNQAERMNDLEHALVPVDQILRGSPGVGDIASMIALLCIAVPFGEELFFRGLAYGAMQWRWSRPIAIGVSAAFFSAVHMQIIHFLPIFVLGLILAYAYDRTGSLVPPFLVHATNNLVAILSTLYGWNV